jgi:phage shock protein A
MEGSTTDREERLAAAERMLKAMEESLARTKKRIEQTRANLDEAAAGDASPEMAPEPEVMKPNRPAP